MPNDKGLVYGHRIGRITGKAIAEKLGWDYSEGYIDDPTIYRAIFRYGNSSEIRGRADCPLGQNNAERHIRTINISAAIKATSNKYDSRVLMLARGVPTPKCWLIGDNDSTIATTGWEEPPSDFFPMIARPLYHFGGRSFSVVNTIEEYRKIGNGFYASEIIKKRDEFRVFVFRNRVIEIDKKVAARPDANPLIRNHRRGWRFVRFPYTTAPRELVKTSFNAVASFGLDFGAVDICDTEDGRYYVFEVNSAPGLIPRKIERLTEKVLDYLSEG